MNLKSKFRGALIETGIGDSLGGSLEGGPRIDPAEARKIVSNARVLSYTDDT